MGIQEKLATLEDMETLWDFEPGKYPKIDTVLLPPLLWNTPDEILKVKQGKVFKRNFNHAATVALAQKQNCYMVVDFGASKQRPICMPDVSPCATAARSSQFRLWVMQVVNGRIVKLRPLDLKEMLALQGWKGDRMKKLLASIKVGALAHAVGNGMCVPIVIVICKWLLDKLSKSR